METTTNFEYDIFVSYAHKDNEISDKGPSEGWVKKFVDYLQFDLERLVGGEIKIWVDNRELDGNDFFDSKIPALVKKSAIMLCFDSPSYCGSDWCKKEVRLFREKAEKEGLDMGFSSRIVHLLLYDLPRDMWLPEFADRTGFRFHEKVNDQGDWTTADPLKFDAPNFNQEMKKLRTAIFKLINQFKNQTAEDYDSAIYVDVPEESGFTVYFGDAPESLLSTRKTIISSLQKKGYKIILNSRKARESKDHEEETKQVLEHANLAIHLLDQHTGHEIIGDNKNWYRKKQVEIGLASDVPQMIWLSPDINTDNIEPEGYKLFIQGLEKGTLTDKEGKLIEKVYEFIRRPKAVLTKDILDYIDVLIQKKKAEEQSKEVASHEELDILLDYNVEDKPYAMELQKSFEKYHFVTHYAPLGQDPVKNQRTLESRLDQVKKLVFVYGKSSRDWVQSRINTVANKLLWNESPIEDIYIYAAPPHKESNDDLMVKAKNINGIPVNIIDYSKHEVVDSTLLDKFINNIKGVSDA